MGQVAPPSAWVCPPEPGVLSASYSWGESSPAAAAEMAGEGHRWSRFQRGSVSPDVPQTPSKAKKCTVVMQRKPILYIKAGNLARGKKGRVLSSKQNNTSNKQGSGDIRRPKEQSYLRIKDFSSSSHKEVSGEERMLGRWKRADIPRWICRDQTFVAFQRNLKKRSWRGLKIRTDLEDFSHLALLREGAVVLYRQHDGHVGVDKCRPANCFHHILRITGEIQLVMRALQHQLMSTEFNGIQC